MAWQDSLNYLQIKIFMASESGETSRQKLIARWIGIGDGGGVGWGVELEIKMSGVQFPLLDVDEAITC